MATENWPFQNPNIDFGTQLESSIKRSKKESGRVRQESIDETQWFTHSVSWELSSEEKYYLESFVKHKLNNGADWFNMDLPLASGGGVLTTLVRIVDGKLSYSYQSGGQFWLISGSIETDDSHVPSEANLDVYLATL